MAHDVADQKKTALLAGLAGLGALAAAFLGWYEMSSSSGTEKISGLESAAGMGTLGIGIVLLVAAAFLMFRGAKTGGKGSSVVILVAALTALFASGYSAGSPEEAIVSFESSDVADSFGISEAEAEVLIRQAIDSGELEVKAETGAMLAVGPSLLGVIAGILGIKRSKQIHESRSQGLAPAVPAPAESPSA